MTTTPTPTEIVPHHSGPARRVPLILHIAAWSVPVLVIAQFSMVAILPVAALVIGTLVSRRARPLRWWAGALAVAYAAPLVIWIVREDGAQSLSKDMHPALGALIVAVSLVVLVKISARRKR